MAFFRRFILRSLLLVLAFAMAVPSYAQKASQTLKTIVIDPGHGGHDPGAVSKDGKTQEKNITLAISKIFGQMIKEAYPDVKVIYTRTTDVYVTLNERAAIANRNQANLFVSVHINSFPTTAPCGFSAHILGESSKGHDLQAFNLNECKRENSVMLLEDDYTEKYEGFNPNEPESFIFFHLMQNAFYEQSLLFAADVVKAYGDAKVFTTSRGIQQDPFWVLWKTAMPSVLVESGFISNANDLAVLRSEDGPRKIAAALLEAFKVFKARYDGSVDYQQTKPVVSTKPTTQPEEKTAKTTSEVSVEEAKADVRYGVQVLVSSRQIDASDAMFKGEKVTVYKSGSLFKYVVGETDSETVVKNFFAKVKDKFEDSFIVRIEDGTPKFWGRR